MRTITVELGERSYPIYIGTRLLYDKNLLIPYIQGKTVAIVTNETIAPLYLKGLEDALVDFRVVTIILPDGEEFKSLSTLNSIYDQLLKSYCDRKTTLIALGGGVIGDITGFAAATYQRGIPFIQIPTTLLAQVDSSVGGKTAVNHALGKNMIGAFYQPCCVIADIDTLKTLENRQLSAGIAEIIKYGIIYDAAFFSYLEDNIAALYAQDQKVLSYAIEQSCIIKAKVVEADEKESGIRAILNLGHTFGHAIEAAQGYGNWLHGEAVATGMCMAAEFSYLLGNIDKTTLQRIIDLIKKAYLPIKPPETMNAHIFKQYMAVDKKVEDGAIRLVLIEQLGKAYITKDYSIDLLDQLFANYY